MTDKFEIGFFAYYPADAQFFISMTCFPGFSIGNKHT